MTSFTVNEASPFRYCVIHLAAFVHSFHNSTNDINAARPLSN